MKILLTGASGFVGGAVLRELEAKGHEVIAVSHGDGPGRALTETNLQPADLRCDIGDAASVNELASVGDVDAVVHCAGLAHRSGKTSDEEFRRVNVGGVMNVANLAERLHARHFLHFSSTLVYGGGQRSGPVDETAECVPHDTYSRSKLEGERAARTVCEAAGIALTIFRPAPIVGEGSKGNFARLIRAIDRRRFVWVGSGSNRKSVVYVGDAAKAVAVVLKSGGGGGRTFNLAAEPVTMTTVVGTIAAALGRRLWPVRLPAAPVRALARMAAPRRMAAMLDTWLSDDVYSNARLSEAYGFTPETPAEEALEREVAYYLKHK